MGILLTLPTSSAAIWVAIAAPILSGGSAEEITAMYIAGGAATVGCACRRQKAQLNNAGKITIRRIMPVIINAKLPPCDLLLI